MGNATFAAAAQLDAGHAQHPSTVSAVATTARSLLRAEPYTLHTLEYSGAARKGLKAAQSTCRIMPNERKLLIEIETPIPETIVTGAGTAFYLAGHCHHPAQAIRRLEILLDDQVHV